MKFNVHSKTLYALASGVSKVINAKNALTILNNFLFDLQGNTLYITGSDVENSLTARVSVTEAEGEGKFCIDARRLVDLLKELPDQGLTFEVAPNLEVSITYPGGDYSMVATPGDQYPEYKMDEDDNEEPQMLMLPTSALLSGIEKTIFAVGTDDFHPQMMGILLDFKPESLTFVATDTRKLVRFDIATVKPGFETRCILPIKPAAIIRSVFGKDEDIQMTLTSKSATIKSDSFHFNCRFIKGRFPDYNRVIPTNNPYTLRVDRMRFLNAVRRVGVFVDPGFGLEKFRITNDKVYLKSSDTNMNTKGNENLDCEYEGPEIVIGFSAPYLIEICNTLSTEEILIKLSDPSRPGVFCPSSNDEGTDLVILLMPMNVQDF